MGKLRMDKRIYIAISINEKYAAYAYVLLVSLFEHHAADSITVYIMQSDLTAKTKQLLYSFGEQQGQEIVFVTVSLEQILADLTHNTREGYTTDALPTTENWSREMYYRLLLGEMIPKEINRVLYLDVDIIVNGNLSEFYFQELDNMELAVADDPMIQGNFSLEQQELFRDMESVRYFNSGVLLYDLEVIRKSYTFLTYIDVARQYQYRLTNPDQDLLNYVHMGKVKYVDNTKYNLFSQIAEMEYGGYEYVARHGIIIHFAGRKPWNYSGVHYSTEKIWWDYASETPFYQDMLEKVFYDGLWDDSYQTIMDLKKENNELKKNLEQAMAICQKLLNMN